MKDKPVVSGPASLPPPRRPAAVGIVVIGRNEGERLKRCLESVRGSAVQTVYVDSGSTDESVAFARSLGVLVLELDLSTPFTAARARNAGFERLLKASPSLDHVFFVDGDCEVASGWVEKASRFLVSHPDVAVVFGRRREQYPERSVYNRLCDIEWDTPIGAAKGLWRRCHDSGAGVSAGARLSRGFNLRRRTRAVPEAAPRGLARMAAR